MYKDITACLCCGNKELFRYMDLGSQPLANSYMSKLVELRRYPLEVMFCKECSHSQLSIAVEPKEMFSDYKYVSGTTATLRNYFKDFAADVLTNYSGSISKGASILDIGSNDGSLLQEFKKYQCNVFGVDPAENLRQISIDGGVDLLTSFWSSKTAWSVSQYDIITALNVFAHNPNPLDFLIGCRRALKKTGQVVIQFPYNKNTIKETQFDQIYHEHISYFTVQSFANLVERAGFYISRINESPIHGGSIIFTLQLGSNSHCLDVHKYIQEEIAEGLDKYDTYIKFTSAGRCNIITLFQQLRIYTEKGFKIVGYGASAKSSTLLNNQWVTRYNCGQIPEFFIDDNPLKHLLYTPGQGIPIGSLDDWINQNNDPTIYLCTSWNFLNEIKEKLKSKLPEGRDYIITYVPYVHVLKI